MKKLNKKQLTIIGAIGLLYWVLISPFIFAQNLKSYMTSGDITTLENKVDVMRVKSGLKHDLVMKIYKESPNLEAYEVVDKLTQLDSMTEYGYLSMLNNIKKRKVDVELYELDEFGLTRMQFRNTNSNFKVVAERDILGGWKIVETKIIY